MSPKKLIFRLLRYSGLPLLFREILQRNKVSIAMFHDIAPAAAERAFGFLASRYRIISLEDYLRARQTGTPLPPKALIITLDDGYSQNYELLPVVRKMQIPITIFLCAGLLGANRHFWFLYKRDEMQPERLKKMPNAQRLQVLADAGFRPDMEFSYPHSLNREQILEMKGHIDLQSHTVFHPCLPKCEDREAWEEIAGAKKILEEEYGLNVHSLAFPNGDYSGRDIEMAKKAGYQCAITVDYGFNTLKSDPYRLKRLSIDDSGDIDALSLKVSGVWTLFRILTGGQRRNRYENLQEKYPAGRLEPISTPN